MPLASFFHNRARPLRHFFCHGRSCRDQRNVRPKLRCSVSNISITCLYRRCCDRRRLIWPSYRAQNLVAIASAPKCHLISSCYEAESAKGPRYRARKIDPIVRRLRNSFCFMALDAKTAVQKPSRRSSWGPSPSLERCGALPGGCRALLAFRPVLCRRAEHGLAPACD